jgi:hypothetical protein
MHAGSTLLLLLTGEAAPPLAPPRPGPSRRRLLLLLAARRRRLAVVPPAVELAPDLPTALWDALAADGGLAAAFGKAAGGEDGWLQWGDGEAGLPYAVLLAPVDLVPSETTFAGTRTQTTQAQIAVYAAGKDEAQALGTEILAAFDDEVASPRIPTLTWTAGREIARFPKDPGFAELDPDPGPDGEPEVWAYRVLVDLWIVRVRAVASA